MLAQILLLLAQILLLLAHILLLLAQILLLLAQILLLLAQILLLLAQILLLLAQILLLLAPGNRADAIVAPQLILLYNTSPMIYTLLSEYTRDYAWVQAWELPTVAASNIVVV